MISLIIIGVLLFAHWIGDFVLQTDQGEFSTSWEVVPGKKFEVNLQMTRAALQKSGATGIGGEIFV